MRREINFFDGQARRDCGAGGLRGAVGYCYGCPVGAGCVVVAVVVVVGPPLREALDVEVREVCGR